MQLQRRLLVQLRGMPSRARARQRALPAYQIARTAAPHRGPVPEQKPPSTAPPGLCQQATHLHQRRLLKAEPVDGLHLCRAERKVTAGQLGLQAARLNRAERAAPRHRNAGARPGDSLDVPGEAAVPRAPAMMSGVHRRCAPTGKREQIHRHL